jgi:CRP-like cAMP-binding protein
VDGLEKTIRFFTENQAAVLFRNDPSDSYLTCLEDCLLIVGEVGQEEEMYQQFPKLEQITRSMIEQDFAGLQEAFARFITSTPEARYLNILETRPDLLHRVPQHQLASYIGVTPESLSRIRKRIAKAR